MQITFDTTTITDDEVRGIFALLDTVRPSAFDLGEQGPIDVEKFTETLKAGLTEAAGAAIANRAIPITLADNVQQALDANPDHLKGEDFTSVPIPPTHDSTGIPWDERIHASSKALNADGTWRTKRGVDKALVARVEAELRGQHSYDSDVTPEAVQQVREAAAPALENADLEHIDPPVAPPAPPAPEAPKAPLAPAVTESAVSPFVALMKRVTAAQTDRELTQPRVKELLESLDKKSIMDLRTDDKALASFAVILTAELNGTLAEVAEACGGLKPENIKSILAILPGEGV